MSEAKRKWPYVVIAAIASGVLGLAAFTDALDTLVTKWRLWSPQIGAVLSTVTPWLFAFVIVYCASVLLIVAYGEWRQGKRTLARKRRSEIESLRNRVNGVLLEAEANRPEDRDSLGRTALDRALERLKEALVQSSTYERRVPLYEEVAAMENRCLNNAGRTFQRDEAEPSLAVLRRWADFASAEVSPEPSPRPSDPFAPITRRPL
jgi:hypothetical protein